MSLEKSFIYDLLLVLSIILLNTSFTALGAEEHVYYGYIPPSTDLVELIDLVDGVQYNYTPPSGSAILDIVGIHDNTKVEIWNIVTGEKMYTFTISPLEKKTIFMPYGTYFKIVSNKRVFASIVGGNDYPGGVTGEGHGTGGTGTFYPSAEGGFIGKEYIFIPMTVTAGLVAYEAGSNMLILGLEDIDFQVVDSSGKWSLKGSLKQHEAKRYLLWCRIQAGFPPAVGAGNSMIFKLQTSHNTLVAAVNTGCLVAVPALTGGFVGKIFYLPSFFSYKLTEGSVAALLITPIEPCKVEIYEAKTLEKIAEQSFNKEDIAENKFWFYKLGAAREKEYIIKSTGKVTVLAGSTMAADQPEYLGPDVTFLGAKPNEEIRFYVPTLAVVFSPEDAQVTIDGQIMKLRKDSYTLIDTGTHTIKSDQVVIIEIISTSIGLVRWGTCLIEPIDILKTYEIPSGFAQKKETFPTWIIYVAIAVIIVVAISFFFIKRKR